MTTTLTKENKITEAEDTISRILAFIVERDKYIKDTTRVFGLTNSGQFWEFICGDSSFVGVGELTMEVSEKIHELQAAIDTLLELKEPYLKTKVRNFFSVYLQVTATEWEIYEEYDHHRNAYLEDEYYRDYGFC